MSAGNSILQRPKLTPDKTLNMSLQPDILFCNNKLLLKKF